MTEYNYRGEAEKLAKTIAALQDRVTALEAAGLRIPFVDANPSATYGANMWMFNDNKIHIRKPDGTIREIITTAPVATTTGTPLPTPVAQTTTHRTEWSASWSQTYQQDGDQRNENYLHVGYGGDSFNGRQTSLIGFPFATIRSALSGARITKVEVYLYATHCWWNSGSTLYVGTHTNGSSPPANLGGINHTGVSTCHVKGSDQGGEPDSQRWKAVSTSIGNWFRDSQANGITLSAPSNSSTFYAVLGGVGSGAPAPRLRITYVN